MNKVKTYEKALIFMGTTTLIGLGLLGLFVLMRIHWLPFVALLLCFVFSFLILKSFSTFKDSNSAKDWALAILIISCICTCFILFDNHKGRAIIENIFIPGKVAHKTYYVENDDGPGGRYETTYFLKVFEQRNQVYVEILDWTFIIFAVALPILIFKIYGSVYNLWKEKKFRERYSYDKETLPDLSNWTPKD
jgi:hypothetical protein